VSERLYHQAILERARSAFGAGRLPAPDASAVVDNPLCGDRVGIDITLVGGRVERLAHQVRGCALCQAAASILAERAPGHTPAALIAATAAARAMLTAAGPIPPDWPELTIFEPVRPAKSRHDCVLLPFEALEKALGAAPRKVG
jgi:nitrogen fixation NifU-like protein